MKLCCERWMNTLNKRLDALLNADEEPYGGLLPSSAALLKKLRQNHASTLIVLSGDVSDVDGFYGLAKYAQLKNVDVLFIMNYPAFLNSPNTGNYTSDQYKETMEIATVLQEGKGYRYGTRDMLYATDFLYNSKPSYAAYKELLRLYNITIANAGNYFDALTNLAFFMASSVWNEVENANKGKLFFEIGGINSINPFHVSSIKNELFVYAGVIQANGFTGAGLREKAIQGNVFGPGANQVQDPVADPAYTRIYLDFSGSMAFFNHSWREKLELCNEKIAACFIMGGVFTEKAPTTMPAIKYALNRFSCATMNQFYHPQNSYSFFKFLQAFQIQTFTVCNNTIPDLKTFTDTTPRIPTDDGWKAFLNGNNLTGSFLQKLAQVYYNSPYGGPHKAFDYYTALALAQHARGGEVNGTLKLLLYNPTYAATFVSWKPIQTCKAAVAEYKTHIDLAVIEEDTPFIKAKKKNQEIELHTLSKETQKVFLPVTDLSFTMDATSRHLTLNP